MRAPDTTAIPDPYIGLRPYTESAEDQARFFGREQDKEIIISNLYAAPLTILYGASGVGKSSVLLAGVVPELRRTPRFACIVFRQWQTDNLLAELKAAVLDAVNAAAKRPVAPDLALPLDEFLVQCARGFRGHIVFIFDQFEEYFLYHPPSAVSEGFDAEFARSVNRPETDTSFLLAMREDGLSKLDRFQGRIPNLLNNLLRLDHLDRDGAKRAICEPLAAYNRALPTGTPPVGIDDKLVEALLEQVKSGSVAIEQAVRGGAGVIRRAEPETAMRIETPFLQMVLTRLWEEERKSSSRQLRLKTLDRLGGAAKIVRTHLDKTMRKLRRRQRRVATDIFHYLVTPSGSKIAFTAADLATYTSLKEKRLTPLLEKLCESGIRLLRPVSPPDGDPAGIRYEIFHDVLAPAVLAWRRRKLVWRRVWRIARWTLGLGTAVLFMLAVIGYAIIEEEKKTKHALTQAEEALHIVEEHDKAVPYLERVFRGHTAPIFCLAVSADGTRVVTGSDDGTARVWEIASGKSIAELGLSRTGGVGAAVFSPDGKLVATASGDYAVRVWEVSSGKLLSEFKKHTNFINDLKFSPDGSRIASASSDGTAEILETRTGRPVFTLKGHANYVNSVAFNASGSMLVTSSADHTARIWDANTGEIRHVLEGHKGSIYSAVFSPDGKRVLTASLDKTARTWNVATGKPITSFAGHEDVVMEAVFSPDGSLVATTGADGTVRTWLADNGRPLKVMRGHTSYVRRVVFSPDGRRLISASEDNTARLWDVATGQLDAVLASHTRDVTAVAFTPDGEFVLTASADGTARLWTGRSVPSLCSLSHDAEVYDAMWSKDGKLIATASSDHTARIWNAPSGTPVAVLRGHEREVSHAHFSPDGTQVLTASRDNRAALWDVRTGKLIRWLSGHANWVSDAVFSEDGRFLATASWDQTAILYNLKSGQEMRLEWHKAALTIAAFSPDGEMLVTGDEDGAARVWKTGDGAAFLELAGYHQGKLVGLEFSPDGRSVLTVSNDSIAVIWPLEAGVKSIALRGHIGALTSGAFSPDGSLVATSSQDCAARIWNARTGDLVTEVRHSDAVWSVAFSPDGRWLATASGDGSARVWDVQTGRRLAELRGHSGDVNQATFSPDGRFIVTASTDHTARVWPVGKW